MRFKFLVTPKLQLAIILYVNAACALMLGLFYYATHRVFGLLENAIPGMIDASASATLLTFLQKQEEGLHAILLIGGCLVLALVSTVGLVLSHRIAGPLYAIRRHFLDLAEGHAIHPIQLRRGDYFTDLAEASNRFLQRIGANKASETTTTVRPRKGNLG